VYTAKRVVNQCQLLRNLNIPSIADIKLEWLATAASIQVGEIAMADVFISYSKRDRPIVIKLSAFLEAEGYSTWWDESLEVAVKYRDIIMQELGEARAVIVVWSEEAIESDWVRAEAGRALQLKKLIPIRTKSAAYDAIPLPFGEMHTLDISDGEKILQAVKKELTKPQIQISVLGTVWKKTRYKSLAWAGVIGGALTLASNLEGLLTLSNTLRWIFGNWVWLLQLFWNALLLFEFEISAFDAVFLTVFMLIAGNVIRSSRTQLTLDSVAHPFPYIPLIIIGGTLTLTFVGVSNKLNKYNTEKFNSHLTTIFSNDLDCQQTVNIFTNISPDLLLFRDEATSEDIERYVQYSKDAEACGIEHDVDIPALRVMAREISSFTGGLDSISSQWYLRSRFEPGVKGYFYRFLLFLPVLLPFCIYGVARIFLPLRLDTSLLSRRLWQIIGGATLLIALNFVMLGVEQNSWANEILDRFREI